MPQQLEFFEIPSPCRGVCQVDERGYCRGCMRNREERFGWMKMSDAEKRNVLRLCRQRFIRYHYQRLKAEQAADDSTQQPSLF